MPHSELEPYELLQIVASFLEEHQINYRVVGSLASMSYGEPRFTNDVDILVQLQIEHIPTLCQKFSSPEYYLSAQAMESAIHRKKQFNIIHPASGLKVDIIIPSNDEFSCSEMSRGKKLTLQGKFSAWFGSPEDIILKKLVYFQQGGGEKHLRDITGMLKIQHHELDLKYLNVWLSKLNVTEEWEMIISKCDSEFPTIDNFG